MKIIYIFFFSIIFLSACQGDENLPEPMEEEIYNDSAERILINKAWKITNAPESRCAFFLNEFALIDFNTGVIQNAQIFDDHFVTAQNTFSYFFSAADVLNINYDSGEKFGFKVLNLNDSNLQIQWLHDSCELIFEPI